MKISYKHNALFFETFSVWLAEMDSQFVDIETTFAEKAHRLSNIDMFQKHLEKRPSFRRGLKKIGKGLGAVGGGVVTIATVPLALVGLPLALIGGGFAPSGTSVGRVGTVLAVPCVAAFSLTAALTSGALEPNLRLTKSYHESQQIRACIARIQKKIKLV